MTNTKQPISLGCFPPGEWEDSTESPSLPGVSAEHTAHVLPRLPHRAEGPELHALSEERAGLGGQ